MFNHFKRIILVILLIPLISFPADRVLKIYVIPTADDDGSHAAGVSGDFFEKMIAATNQTYAGTGVQFVFDKTKDIHATVNKTLLNRDFDLAPGANLNADEEEEPRVIRDRYTRARNIMASYFIGRLVVFVSHGDRLKYNDLKKEWQVLKRGGGFSSWIDEFVALPDISAGGDIHLFAHEVGHYLHAPHTFGRTPKTEDEVREIIRIGVDEWGYSTANVLDLFDADRAYVTDTPPDPGSELWDALAPGKACGPTNELKISVTFGNGTSKSFTFKPDRTNIMSYFKSCTTFNHSLSPGQAEYIRVGIDFGNRHHLIESKPKRFEPLAPVVVSWGPGRLDMFATGVDTGIRHKAWDDSTGWIPKEKKWEFLGGFTKGRPAVVSWGANRLDIFVRGIDDNIYHKAWDGSTWSPSKTSWESLGGNNNIAQELTVISRQPGSLDVFAVNKEGFILHKQWTNQGWTPVKQAWKIIGGNAAGKVAAVSWNPGRIDIVVRAKSGAVLHKALDNNKWFPSAIGTENLGGATLGDPAIVSWGPDRLDIMVRGLKRGYWHKAWSTQGWHPSTTGWELLGGAFTDSPSMITRAANDLVISGRGTDGRIYFKHWSSQGWSPSKNDWTPIPGRGLNSPALVSWAIDRYDIVVRERYGGIFHKIFQGGKWHPSLQEWNDLGRYIE